MVTNPSPACNAARAETTGPTWPGLSDQEAEIVAVFRAGGERLLLADLALTLTDDEASEDDAALAVQLFALIGQRFAHLLRVIDLDPTSARAHLRADVDRALEVMAGPLVVATLAAE